MAGSFQSQRQIISRSDVKRIAMECRLETLACFRQTISLQRQSAEVHQAVGIVRIIICSLPVPGCCGFVVIETSVDFAEQIGITGAIIGVFKISSEECSGFPGPILAEESFADEGDRLTPGLRSFRCNCQGSKYDQRSSQSRTSPPATPSSRASRTRKGSPSSKSMQRSRRSAIIPATTAPKRRRAAMPG